MTRFVHFLHASLLALLFCAVTSPAPAAEIGVSNGTELAQALKAAAGGERILLADGNYGTLDLTLRPEGQVTIAARNPGQARFETVKLTGSANLGFEGIAVKEGFSAQNSRAIDLRGIRTKTFYFRDVEGLHVEASEAAGGKFGLVLNSVRDFVIRNNRLHEVTEDVMRITGRSFNGLVEGNRIYETLARRPVHPDLLQFFPQKDYTPHDIIIRRNLFWDDPATGEVPPQAIFLGDSGSTGFRNILIEENLIAVGHTNTIYVNGGQENVVVRNNTLMSVKGSTMPDAMIRLATKGGKDNSGTVVHGNIVRAIHDETKKSRVAGNFVYGNADRLPQLLAGPGRGRDWRDFMPVGGSAVDFGTGFGAQDFLKALLEAQKPKP